MAMDISAVSGFFLNIGIMLLSILFLGLIVGGTIYGMRQYKRWSQFTCIIWGLDGFGQIVEKKDRAGIFVDGKTKNKRFYLRKHNVGLDCNNVPYIQSGSRKMVYLLQVGLKNFQFIKPKITEDMIHFDVGEEDVNWAVNSYERVKKLFNQNILLQYMPFILLAFVSIIILIMFIYFFKQFPELVKMGQHFEEAAKALAQSRGILN